MPSKIENKRIWRGVVLGMLLVALMGPWVFNIIHVPAEFPCSAPYIRLTGDFCGERVSGMWVLTGIFRLIGELVNGTAVAPEALLGLMFSIPLLMPVISSLILLLVGDRRPWLVFHLIALILAAGVILLSGLFREPRLAWAVWGVWLYVGSAAVALIGEVVFLAARRRPSEV